MFPHYIMDFIEGETLAQRLTRGPLGAREARTLGRSLLGALGEVHARGIVHRDIKPGNVFVSPKVLLTDFGIARSKDDDALTQEGQIFGTPAYMPWEQRGGEATAATDVCAASALLFEAVTGRRWNFAAPPDRADWSDVPRSIRGVLREGLAFNPSQRPHAEALRDALKEPRSSADWRSTVWE